ncbi:MAG: hypothetical protein ACE5J7_01190 [Candidatus Aenigmatarchaeota archaeon]
MAINREYSRLKKKYKKLPDWAWLRKNFTVKIEEDGAAIEQVKNTMVEKLESVNGKIEPILSGAENFCCYFERRMLARKQKEKMFELYKKIQSLLWRSSAINVSPSEKECVEWVIDAKEFWETNKRFFVDTFHSISKGWKAHKEAEVETAYHG